jgi:hypothetical protein
MGTILGTLLRRVGARSHLKPYRGEEDPTARFMAEHIYGKNVLFWVTQPHVPSSSARTRHADFCGCRRSSLMTASCLSAHEPWRPARVRTA